MPWKASNNQRTPPETVEFFLAPPLKVSSSILHIEGKFRGLEAHNLPGSFPPLEPFPTKECDEYGKKKTN